MKSRDAVITVRDHFAGLALEGDWASQNPQSGEFQQDATVKELQFRAALYYRMADAMIAEREREP